VLSKSIDIILNNSAALNLKDLCICKNKLVWVLYCDILCLNYDGSVIDACTGAMMAALKTCKYIFWDVHIENIAIWKHLTISNIDSFYWYILKTNLF